MCKPSNTWRDIQTQETQATDSKSSTQLPNQTRQCKTTQAPETPDQQHPPACNMNKPHHHHNHDHYHHTIKAKARHANKCITKPRHNNNQKNKHRQQTNKNYNTQMSWIQILRLRKDKRIKKPDEHPQTYNKFHDRNDDFQENKSLG